jgi:hypothetical protein
MKTYTPARRHALEEDDCLPLSAFSRHLIFGKRYAKRGRFHSTDALPHLASPRKGCQTVPRDTPLPEGGAEVGCIDGNKSGVRSLSSSLPAMSAAPRLSLFPTLDFTWAGLPVWDLFHLSVLPSDELYGALAAVGTGRVKRFRALA